MEIKVRGNLIFEAENGFRISLKLIELLQEIQRTNSLNSAVKSLGMSYSYAWNLIHKANCKLDQTLLEKKRGGNGGGTAELTDIGIQLLQNYEKFEKRFNTFLKEQTIKIN